ncbi:MAG: Holliday junction resolvase RuvX [Lachnospiraceae bacterium]|nr:Holliday junction resolvase RuvX [Lachnospiraceae bacterium]
MKKRKILGIDYGDFTIGLAIFDLETDFIYPYKTIFRTKANVLRKSIREIVKIVKTENISYIVVGLPLNADGTEGDRVDKVKLFSNMLINGLTNAGFHESNIPIMFQDERLTTVEAKSILKERGIPKTEWKKSIDQIAAEIILTDYKQVNKL